MAIRWKLAGLLKGAGIDNPHQLAEKAGIGYPAAVRIFAHLDGEPLGRFDMRTLDTVMTLLKVKSFDLILERDPPTRRRR